MIKTLLATSFMVLGMSAGTAFAQERTFTAWGHDFTTNDTAAPASLSALASRPPMEARAVAGDTQINRRAGSAQ